MRYPGSEKTNFREGSDHPVTLCSQVNEDEDRKQDLTIGLTMWRSLGMLISVSSKWHNGKSVAIDPTKSRMREIVGSECRQAF